MQPRGDDILRSIREMKEHIRRAHIFVLSGGFSSGDEPDGSAKFIVNVLNNKDIREEIHALLDRGGLILGICNGFQALVKSGLLPYGRLGMVTKDSPTLFRNDVNRHISQIVSTRVSTLNSPWLAASNWARCTRSPSATERASSSSARSWPRSFSPTGRWPSSTSMPKAA